MTTRVVVVGSGGREHALVRALLRLRPDLQVVAVPGNPGFGSAVPRRAAAVSDLDALVKACRGAELVIVGPEAPLVAGLADRLRADGQAVLGPSQAAARLEGSKAFAKEIMDRAGVPTARWARFDDVEPAQRFAAELGGGAVVKADGLAAGKGVVVATEQAEAEAAIEVMLAGAHGEASRTLVVEERLVGEELSVLALCDGERLRLFPPAQDHKRLLKGDRGPNTGGMGAYAPAPLGTTELVEHIRRTCMQPVVDLLRSDGSPLVGVLYAGIMVTADGPRVLEYNVRFGDPETQSVLPLVDEDLYAQCFAAAEGRLEAGNMACRGGAAVTVVMASAGYPTAPRRGDAITGLDAAEAEEGVHVDHAGTAQTGGGFVTHGGRVLGVTGVSDDLRTAAARAYAGVSKIRFEGAQYRRDIAARGLAPEAPG